MITLKGHYQCDCNIKNLCEIISALNKIRQRVKVQYIQYAHQNILICIKGEKVCTNNCQIDTKVYVKLLNRQNRQKLKLIRGS